MKYLKSKLRSQTLKLLNVTEYDLLILSQIKSMGLEAFCKSRLKISDNPTTDDRKLSHLFRSFVVICYSEYREMFKEEEPFPSLITIAQMCKDLEGSKLSKSDRIKVLAKIVVGIFIHYKKTLKLK